MAVTADQVQVVLEANVAKYQANLKAADKTLEQVADNSVRWSNRIANASANSFNTGNIAAQFQDIGVTAASGMNPLIIALQQGTQLSAILNQSLSQGINPAKALGSAFLQVINPISLATLAAVALTAAVSQYVASVVDLGGTSEEELKKQQDAIEALAKSWGDVLPYISEYVRKKEEAERAQQTEDARVSLIADAWEKTREQFKQAYAEYVDLQTILADTGEAPTAANELREAWIDLQKGVEAGTVTAEQNSRVTAALAAIQKSTQIPAIRDLIGAWTALSGAIAAASAAAGAAATETGMAASGEAAARAAARYVVQQKLVNDMSADELELYKAINSERDRAIKNGTYQALGEERIVELAKEQLDAENRRAAAKKAASDAESAGKKSAREAEQEREAILKLIETLEYERSIVGMSDEDKAVSNALREAGAAATDRQRERIEELVRATMQETEALAAADEQLQAFLDMGKSGLQTFIDKWIETGDAAKAFGAALSDIGRQLINMGLNNLFSQGGPVASLFAPAGARASGGPVSGGRTYLVGEKGPELFTPSGAGNITPNHQIGGAMSLTYAPVIDNRGADIDAVARLERVMVRQAAEFDGRVKKIVSNAGRTWKVA
jgi:hypothetical protein